MKLINKNPKLVFWVVFGLLFLIWTFTQFYRLNQTMSLDWDFARHAFYIFDWYTTGQAPPAGPFVSYINFTLPPTYYWIIYPFYLVTNGSLFYNHIACFVYTWVIFLGLALALYKRPAYRWSFLLLIALACFNSSISANRLVYAWNPSYVWQPVVVAWYCLALASQSKRRILLCVIGGITCAVAISIELLIVPVVIGLLVVSAVRLRKQVLPWLISFLVASLILWTPILTVQFNQVLSNDLILPEQSSEPFLIRFYNSLATSLAPNIHDYGQVNLDIRVVALYTVILAVIIFHLKKNWGRKILHQDWFQLLLVLVVSLAITTAPPIVMHFWYSIGIAIVIILLLANLPPGQLKYLLGTLFLISQLAVFTKNANSMYRASPLAIETCLKQACQKLVPYQYYYALYTHAVAEMIPLYVLSTLGCPPAQRWQTTLSDDEILTNLTTGNETLLVIHDVDTNDQHFWIKWLAEEEKLGRSPHARLKPELDKLYQYPIASASCDGNWGWTLYEKTSPNEKTSSTN